ncbi:hypothetical protein [Arthrobacter sp. 2MCAF14]|uniref:hypothetical protein n=1 Tax=Arthrobacter sp. 2MCAF14 TaxID=3232982 RepID=UPI003F9164A5
MQTTSENDKLTGPPTAEITNLHLQTTDKKTGEIRAKALVFHMKKDRLEVESQPDERNQNPYETQD